MTELRGILICGEVLNSSITTTTRELLGLGRKLSDSLNQPLSTLLIGKDIEEAAQEVIALGTDRVYIADGPPFYESHPDFYLVIMVKISQQIAPSIILFGQTDMGLNIAPRLAVRLGASVTMDCVDLNIDPKTKQLMCTKPVYGGNAVAIWVSETSSPQIATLRPRAAKAADPDTTRRGNIIPLATDLDNLITRGKLVETVKEDVKELNLEEAKVIVAGGGGIGGSEGFQLLQELAKVLGGAVGISRVPFDEGWMPLSMEIGQTAHVVSPNLYIAIGISGAPQHMAGCSGSNYIVAINKDPEAHIFKEADFGVVRDYGEFLPPFIEAFKKLLST